MNAAALRFLVVEDHDFQRGAVLRMLARLGATDCLEAADGEAAVRVLAGAQPPVDIIISDLDMPGMDGIEFIRTVGASGRPVAIVATSAAERSVLASVESMAAAYGIALLGVLTKPLMLPALQEVIARHRPAPPSSVAGGQVFSLQEIRAGLARDQFEPFLQPKVELATRRVRGFEALARWRHPEAGVVAPQGFVPVMEEHGLIDDLTGVMLRKAAACCGRWRAAGHDLSVAVNLSVKTLADVQMADRLVALVKAAGIEPRHVILELTESAAAGDKLGPVLENLARLRLKGFGLAIDDFGTGYSSLQQLARVAFTELKIDHSFVRHAAGREAAMILLQSTLEMAHKLKLVSVAEGVETGTEWDLLKRLGCHLAQGYFIARPMDAADVPGWLEAYRSQARAQLSETQ
jgi:EAL domain-containing protein (putative c-di-GMP-specific phosphodiesterase class I)/CheY-like chemotaxis protein